VLDIGCAEGGGLCALVDAGARGLGLEISPSRLFIARRLADSRPRSQIQFLVADFHAVPIRFETYQPDLILLRDVMEHLPDQQQVMARLRAIMTLGCRLLITFPPFYSPFGGHQQMLHSWLRRLPYFHILPPPFWPLFRWLIRHFDDNAAFLPEMEKLRRHRITIRRCLRLAQVHGLHGSNRRFYLSRPSYKLRYGWPVIAAGWLGEIPLLREFLVTGATFLFVVEEK